jgi:hypothetical protein
MKRIVTERTEVELKPQKNLHPHHNPDYGHQKDPQKTELARKGDFGGKSDLMEKLGDVKDKYPGLHITHRHNNTVR